MKQLALLAALSLSVSAHAQNWPSFRGTNASGVGPGSAVPVKWDAAKNHNIAWKTPIPGVGHASPIVWGNRIFISTAIALNGPDEFVPKTETMIQSAQNLRHIWRIVALDRTTGSIVWSKDVAEGAPKVKRHSASTYANPTPATDGKYVVAASGFGTLACLDMNGNVLWKKEFNFGSSTPDDANTNDIATSPILFNDKVILQHDTSTDGYLAAYDIRTGKELWKSERKEIYTWSTPVVMSIGGKTVLVTNSRSAIRGHDPETGRELWKIPVKKGSWDRGPAPIQAGDLAVIAGGGPEQPIYAVRASASGDLTLPAGKTSSEQIAWSTNKGSPYMPTPVFQENFLYVVSEKGILSVYDVRDGHRIYQQRVSPSSGGFSASPVISGGKIYMTSEDGDVFVAALGPKFELLATNPMGEICYATPAVSGDLLFVRTRSALYAIAERK
ncbi:MAG: PQQ-binding-like beta-propeller repeat protein [Acidobacteria bacterium]|nr:PQQ-binding-like beta-propeller repeat protein [Acidobacteriota bacterium]